MKKRYYDKSYDRVIKLNELQYVTGEHIENGCINITSAEMYREVDDLNSHFRELQRKREKFMVDFWLGLGANVLIVFLGLFLLLANTTSQMKTVSYLGRVTDGNGFLLAGIVILCFLLTVIFCFLLKKFNSVFMIAMSIPMVLCSPVFLAFPIINLPVLILLKKHDNELKENVGYPHFVQLVTSYIRDEDDSEEKYEMDTAGIYEDLSHENDIPDLRDNDLFSD